MYKAPLTAILLVLSTGFNSPASGQPGVCRPTAPGKPVNTEDFNPGLGGELGLNDDFHDDIDEPFDDPGGVISEFSRGLAQDGEPGGVQVLKDIVGNDCSPEE